MKNKSDFPSLNQKQPDGRRPNGRPYKLFVVEDKEFQKKQLVQIFESEEYQVVGSASNGREALDMLEKLNYQVDLITTNLDMPVLDGYAMLYELNQKQKKPVVVFVSDDTTKGVMQDLISLGIADFVLKPINRRTLLERIHKAILKAQI